MDRAAGRRFRSAAAGDELRRNYANTTATGQTRLLSAVDALTASSATAGRRAYSGFCTRVDWLFVGVNAAA